MRVNIDSLKNKCIQDSFEKLQTLENPRLMDVISRYASLCNPARIFVCNDSPQNALYLRERALEEGEEKELATPGHTVHYDGYFDQARDKKTTKYLLPPHKKLGDHINSIGKKAGVEEINNYLQNIMKDKEMIVCFFSLGPLNSEFSIPSLQITDSFYVVHSEMILYRSGYEFFKKEKPNVFFTFIHSAGELNNGVSKNIDKRRIYIDLDESIVYSVNTQYAGNTVGLKKPALRLAVHKASTEGWLAEHMFIMGVSGLRNRKTYFTGAFPSACGKTSTAMLHGEEIVGDDIAYLRESNGSVYAVNAEKGMFGILQDVNGKNDPLIWEAVTRPNEIIFTNVLVTDEGVPRWLGDGRPPPQGGMSFSGAWTLQKRDQNNTPIPYAHKNARYTLILKTLSNCDHNIENPKGVPVGGMIYGGRDSHAWPPVYESFDWAHGVITCGASLESEVTFATLDKEGERKFNPFSNLDFLSVPLGTYIKMHLNFGKKLKVPPKIFAVNYFLRDDQGAFLNSKEDKHVWIKWMERRVHNDLRALRTPLGYIPDYADLEVLFGQVLKKEYTEEQYIQQFSVRVKENLAKIERIEKIYQKIEDIPSLFFEVLQKQRQRLEAAQSRFGDCISPFRFKE